MSPWGAVTSSSQESSGSSGMDWESSKCCICPARAFRVRAVPAGSASWTVHFFTLWPSFFLLLCQKQLREERVKLQSTPLRVRNHGGALSLAYSHIQAFMPRICPENGTTHSGLGLPTASNSQGHSLTNMPVGQSNLGSPSVETPSS